MPLLRVIAKRAIYHSLVMDGRSFLAEPMEFLVDMLNHAYWLRIVGTSAVKQVNFAGTLFCDLGIFWLFLQALNFAKMENLLLLYTVKLSTVKFSISQQSNLWI